MTIIYPYPVAFLSDVLPISAIYFNDQRNDNVSGDGKGRVWQSQRATPLWSAKVELDDATFIRDAERMAARIRKLQGAQEAFLLVDPRHRYPFSDPRGAILGNRAISMSAIADGGASVALSGLPANYVLTESDKFSFVFNSAPQRYAYHEVSEPVVANSVGTTPVFGIYPHLPAGVVAGQGVTLAKPPCLMFMKPTTHNPGRAYRSLQGGASFECLQRSYA